MRRFCFCLFGLMLTLSVASAQKLVDKVVGIVDDKVILLSDLESQYQQYVQQYNEKPGKNYMCDVLNQLMTQKLLMAQALIDSVTVTDEEVETELDKRIRYFSNMTGGQSKLEEYYGKSIVEIKDEFRSEIKDQLLSSREQQSIITDVKVNPSEVKAYFNAQPADSLPYYNSEVQVGVIVFYPKLSQELKNLAYQQIKDLKDRIDKGEDFSTLASIYSQDPGSQDKGGDLGFVNRGELDPAFEAAAFNLKTPGEVSPIVESKFGYHIIQLVERRGEKIDVRHILIIPQTTSEDLAKALSHADSVKQMLDAGTIKFAQAVNKYTEDETTRNSGGMLVNPNNSTTYFEIPDLGNFDKSLVFVTDSMKVGDISMPRLFKGKDGKSGYRIIYLKSETKPHKANMLNDYDKIEAAALVQKQTNVMNDWLDEKIKVTFVQVDANFANCESMKKWIQIKSKTNE
jgi:peptidyl-prolyl cis-trans isomerase SurA